MFLRMLSDAALSEFKKIYEAEYSEPISDGDAAALALNLLTFYKYVYRPIKKRWDEEIADEKSK